MDMEIIASLTPDEVLMRNTLLQLKRSSCCGNCGCFVEPEDIEKRSCSTCSTKWHYLALGYIDPRPLLDLKYEFDQDPGTALQFIGYGEGAVFRGDAKFHQLV